MCSLKAIIFDMDGVLLLSDSVHDYAYRKTLEEVGVNDFCYSRFAGMRTDESIKIILQENNINVSSEMVSQLVKRKRYLSNKRLKENVPLASGCKQILNAFSSKFKLALVSSASVKNVELFLNASECMELFDVIVNGEDVKKAKPDPAIYLLALSRLKLQAKECLVVEDAVNGIVSAKAAGIAVCGIPGGASREDLLNAGADMVLENIKGLLEELGAAE